VSSYLYFGGVGKSVGLADVGVLARTDFEDQAGTLISDNSIILASMCVSATSGVTHGAGQNERWNNPNVSGTSICSDMGPFSPINPVETISMSFNNPGGGDVFAMSSVELLNYQSNPSAIMGSAM
jgi:hypothetical protein